MHLRHQWLGSKIDYHQGLERQHRLVESILEGDQQNHFLSLEHSPIYTIGRTRDTSSLGENTESLPYQVIETNRGGQATYHGPGQLTGYPVVNLRLLGKDLHAYIRALEEALIQTCLEYDIVASRRDGLTGVWVNGKKLASIGVGVKKWISMHGFAINITKQSLQGFNSITPCGINHVVMTCIESECSKPVSVKDFAATCLKHLEQALEQIAIE
jgi:lipoyl(octanoyl) transferase